MRWLIKQTKQKTFQFFYKVNMEQFVFFH